MAGIEVAVVMTGTAYEYMVRALYGRSCSVYAGKIAAAPPPVQTSNDAAAAKTTAGTLILMMVQPPLGNSVEPGSFSNVALGYAVTAFKISVI